MHALHPPSTPAIEDRSGELADRKGNIASLKAMLRVLVGPDHSKTCLMFEKNPESTDPDPASYLFENRGHLPQAKPCDQQSELCSRKIISRVQSWTNQCTGVAEGQSEAIIDSSNRLPMADEQTIKPDVCAWSDVLTSFEPGHGLSPDYYTCLTNIQTSHRPRQPEECITGSENHEQHDELKVNAPVQESAFCEERTKPGNYPCGQVHPIPRPSLYMAADPFGSFSETNTTSDTISPSASQESLADSFGHGFRKAHCPYSHTGGAMIFQNHVSPGSSVATTDDPYTPIAGTCSATTPLHWSSSGQMMPWEMQSPEFEYRNSYFSQLHHHGGRVEAIPRNAALDACHGLPSVDCSQHYPQQPPFVLHPFTPREYNSTSIKDRSVVDEGHCQLTFTNDELTYPQHRYEIVESAHSTIASNGALGRRGRASSRSISCHNEARNAFLIECKRRGLSYKDIKRLGGFEEAESTLRGRFRTLTKSKEQRVRKPQWKDKDVSDRIPRVSFVLS
ncbi:hypothetical protein IFM58399_06242 [Aspergillus lentulus]|uniref:Uncharacterized protein n=1 Tax=Aspergillus lentulus TaxID=293939 RepID=A0AAN5YRK5_ASPLE|nr:uncharacterized protein IFM58399_06242 [Aspergillus lentulus]KAF4160506.1 hypothetical protein CNMCM6069_008118 [Aspergillus lentulus]KAF4167986.1 hypothetical protein CNMCM6936_003861 [Aspergillus lentulus]KAF4182617.1 hypothetical protein CNMCM7927_009555 [Aspergillus lentulus]KAF4182784.1 hypothetical protein CNMCM8060_006148 [Aspergillus lentulus]KAF4196068.1 hypothetical protein CNMCM8694_005497 [Aspergillus lentulus]